MNIWMVSSLAITKVCCYEHSVHDFSGHLYALISCIYIEVLSEFRKNAVYKVKIHKSIAFLCTSNKNCMMKFFLKKVFLTFIYF